MKLVKLKPATKDYIWAGDKLKKWGKEAPYDKNLSKLHEIANKELSKIDFGENIYDVNFIRRANDKDVEDIILDVAPYEQLMDFMHLVQHLKL